MVRYPVITTRRCQDSQQRQHTVMPLPQLMPLLAAVALTPCPAPVKAQLDGLYRWQVARQDVSGPIELKSQKSRFTDGLFQKLLRAYALNPNSGRFVDFDLFSGTQVGTFGAKVLGCTAAPGGGLEARVAVRAGLRNRPIEAPQLLRYLLVRGPAGSWKIADIVYAHPAGFRLSSYLAELLGSKP
ncbi:ABC transporter substrate-binding protein [Cyanobium sp. Candia 9D4]|uniref:ABC transporter substrate-binding protein n=1 Tax=Cyanobium sp. Candia 9D4 TaxID=2823707 RepID=UPI0020CE2D2A|nr:ABC transporter substrate-binding protein [Cyanobium sp. Candia 9D4]